MSEVLNLWEADNGRVVKVRGHAVLVFGVHYFVARRTPEGSAFASPMHGDSAILFRAKRDALARVAKIKAEEDKKRQGYRTFTINRLRTELAAAITNDRKERGLPPRRKPTRAKGAR